MEWVSYAVLLVTIVMFAWTVFGPPEPTPYVDVGDSIQAVKGMEGEWPGESLLLVLSPTCSFCTGSLPFYKQLVDQREREVNIIVAIDTSASATLQRRLLGQAGVAPDTTIVIPTVDDRVVYVPTIIHVDQGAMAKRVWVGQLNGEQEEEVLSIVRMK